MTLLSDHIRQSGSAQTGRLGVHRYGIITAVDPATHSVKVSVQPEGVESGWVPDSGFAVGSLRIACPAEIGSQVLLAPAEGDAESPVIIARLFDAQQVPPTSPVTNQPAQAGEMLVMAGQAGAPGSNQQAASQATFMHVTPSGMTFGCGSTMLAIGPSAITMTIGGQTFTFTANNLTSTVDVLAQSKSLINHVHIDVERGSQVSGPPQ